MAVEIEEVSFENVHSLLSIDFGDTPEAFAERPFMTIAYAYCGLLEQKEGFCSAITENGETAGIVLIGEAVPDENDPPICKNTEKYFRLMGFVIDTSRRGRGIGKAALQKVLQKFDRLYPGCLLLLECHEENSAAYHLYLSGGFTDTGHKTDRHRILMRKTEERNNKEEKT